MKETFRDVKVGETFRFKHDLAALPYTKGPNSYAHPEGHMLTDTRLAEPSDPVIRDQKHHFEEERI